MFRVFLRNKVFQHRGRPSADRSIVKKGTVAAPTARERLRNRRIFERFPIDHKHLMLMNEQDILLVREISAKGFSTEVSERALDRFRVGDIYEARIRYLGEVYDLDAKVSWKERKYIGFEIIKASRTTMAFLRRLLRPMEIAASMREVDASFMLNNLERKSWYHGDEGTDLYVWRDDSGGIIAWQLIFGEHYVEWKKGNGIMSGTKVVPETRANRINMKDFNIFDEAFGRDETPDPDKRQTATDILMAIQLPVRDAILATLSE